MINLKNDIYVNLPRGYRLINKYDVNKRFQSNDKNMRDYKLKYFYEWGLEKNNVVLIKESRGNIDGIIMFRFEPDIKDPDRIVIEMLARNFAANNPGSGYLLLRAVESIASQLGIKKIEIEAIKELEDYYESLGYRSTGKNYYDSSWKDIIIMEKSLN
ncbi:Acetyltransferase (GNAT) family [Picrophilus oshimae DSM 9789]|uniref:Acetyltransferase (GNAT) family n=1 Tax=Picrophilus torridus (strain ATCC 700027 / DSM 9790 / JCM 10055 / NBRC 100828 / KAW 2/3) TaxID=1122961 RepID=A0A8G2L6U1_PICTO|nr:Acetyltransferase (GNAT) family [Picrophilus oshimae DSM 9789]